MQTFTEAKQPHYELLDGLRGVAAMLVIWYHFSEGFATSRVSMWLNHGYLAVDFFFVLSGFVIGYAYDNRMRNGMTKSNFMLRRLIRLHPMVVLSVLLGGLTYLIQGSVKWDGTPVSLSTLVIAMLLGLFLIPVIPGASVDVRGNGEMYPLNAPCWSLFFEYIGSLIYATALCKMRKKALWILMGISALGLSICTIGNVPGSFQQDHGWSLGGGIIAYGGFVGGLFRLTFSFCAGLMLTRNFKPRRIRSAFWICSALIAAAMSMPYIGNEANPINGVYDVVCTLFLFPAVVYIGACGTTTDKYSTSTCSWLGKISYPLYIVHYPMLNLFYSWIWTNELTFDKVWPVCVAVFMASILFAYAAVKFYDTPVRQYLTKRLLCSKSNLGPYATQR